MPPTPTDIQLWNALRQGDETAFAALYQRYVRVLYNYGLKVCGHSAKVDDAVQDLFIDLWRMRYNLGTITSSTVPFGPRKLPCPNCPIGSSTRAIGRLKR